MYLAIERIIPFLVLSIFVLIYFLGLSMHQCLLTLTRFLLLIALSFTVLQLNLWMIKLSPLQ